MNMPRNLFTIILSFAGRNRVQCRVLASKPGPQGNVHFGINVMRLATFPSLDWSRWYRGNPLGQAHDSR